MYLSKRLCLVAAGLLCGVSAPVVAQATDAGGRNVYQAAYFERFAPSNALQIVERVPGFKLELGDQEVRGFGQAAGNVVINGQRPSSKSDTLDTILARIPASRVARVEVGPGELFGSEFAGKPQVVNLVLNTAGGLAGTATATARRPFTGGIMPEGSVSALLRRGPSTFNASVGFNNNTSSEEGYDRLITLPGREQTEFRRKVNYTRDPNGYLSAAWEYDGGSNRTAHLNGRAALDRFWLTQHNDVFPANGPIRDDRLTERYRRRDFEIGGDVTRPLFGGGLKLVGLATRRHRNNHDVSLNRVHGDVIGGLAQDLEDQRDESVLRLVWNRSDLWNWSVEAGAEGVLNVLDSRVDLYDIDADGSRTRIDLPVDQAKVKEYRGEAFVNLGRNLTTDLRTDFGLTYEASQLTVSGDASAERTLKFLKPKATLDWHPKGGWHVQLAVSRTVAQLQFEDFISAAELANNGRVNGGNAELVPQRTWDILVTAEHPILGDGLVKLELGHTWVSLVQDRVPTPEGFDAPGNLGDGRENIARATVEAPLGQFGIEGGRLTAYLSVVDTSVRDPYTLENRPFSGNSLWYTEVKFRQDLGKFAWGLNFDGGSASTLYRRDELDRSHSRFPYASAFAEYRPNGKTTVTFGLDNLTNAPGYRERTFFSPDRRTRVPDEFEVRKRNRHVIPYVTLKYNFG